MDDEEEEEAPRDPFAKRWVFGGDVTEEYVAYVDVMEEVADEARAGVDVSRIVDELAGALLGRLDLHMFRRIVGLHTDRDIFFWGCVHGASADKKNNKTTNKFFHKTVASFQDEAKGGRRQRALREAVFEITQGKPTLVVFNRDALPFYGPAARDVPLKHLFRTIRADCTAIIVFVGQGHEDLLFEPKRHLEVDALRTADGNVLAENTLNKALKIYRRLRPEVVLPPLTEDDDEAECKTT